MNPEEKLDVALSFLAEENRGSYLYPDTIEFHKYLTSQGIDEKEHLPILLHLERGKYVDAYYSSQAEKIAGNFPSQIKITFKGIKFNDKGGYVKALRKENFDRVLTNIQKVLAIPTFILAIITVVILVTKKPSTAEVKIRHCVHCCETK